MALNTDKPQRSRLQPLSCAEAVASQLGTASRRKPTTVGISREAETPPSLPLQRTSCLMALEEPQNVPQAARAKDPDQPCRHAASVT